MNIFLVITSSIALLCLAIRCMVKVSSIKSTQDVSENFKKFQHTFYIGYFIACFSDWLQGPYIYKLYAYYGYSVETIACLYVIGFASSSVVGTSIGSFGDKIGRNFACQLYFLFYILCCVTKLSNRFFILAIGRVCGGISTSLLFSSFESWYASEHLIHHSFPQEWMPLTFSSCTFWNGMLAIIAGLCSNVVADLLNFGPVSPFLFSIPFLVFGMVYVRLYWQENYGDETVDLRMSCSNGLHHIYNDFKVFSIGIIQSCYETVLYIFVFLWTPVLSPLDPSVGLVFSSFMISVMIGSLFNELMIKARCPTIVILRVSLIISLVSFAIATIISYLYVLNASPNSILCCYLCFLLFEVSVGIYFPSIGVLRSVIIPDDARSSTMNWFRVPLNVFTCICLLSFYAKQDQGMFTLLFMVSCAFLLIALWFVSNLKKCDIVNKDSDFLHC